MHPDLVGFVACAGMILSLLSGKLFAYGMEKVISRRALPTKCQGRTVRRVWLDCCEERFGELSCRLRKVWMTSHFDRKRWRELNAR
jgi:hypothetical protein